MIDLLDLMNSGGKEAMVETRVGRARIKPLQASHILLPCVYKRQ